MSDLTRKSLTQLAALMRARTVSPVEVLEAHLHRIDQLNPTLNAIVTIAPDAMEKAREAEAALMRDDKTGPLHGVPVTIKDTIETKGLRTTGGSRVRADYVPVEDAIAVARLRKAGAIILGKTNCAEMAATYDTENPVFGHANNPYDLQRTTGGSSGGEAAAIASCLSPGGLGSDLMGSIRVPSHFCGVVGLKPTTGRGPCDRHIPRCAGAIELGAVMGPMARSVEDVRMLFLIIAGLDESESDSLSAAGELDLRGCRVASYVFDGVTPVFDETKRAVESVAHALENAGLDVREEKPPAIEHGYELWSALFARAALINTRSEYAGRENEAGAFIHYLLESAKTAPTAALDEFSKAWLLRNQFRETLLEWMNDTPLIIGPVGAMPAFEHGARKVDIEGEEISIFRAFSYAQTYNVFDLPVASVPVSISPEGLPIGVQIIGRPNAEETVLAVATVVEQAFGGWREPSFAPSPQDHNPL